MESAPARAQSRIPPFRLSKTVQPAPHKGQRRWLSHFSGQSSSADAKNGAKKRVFPKCLLSPRGTRAAGHSVSTHTMLRAALKPLGPKSCVPTTPVSTHTMLRAALKRPLLCGGIGCPWVSTHTMLRAALKQDSGVLYSANSCLDTHNAACGIETIIAAERKCSLSGLDTHNAACGIETLKVIQRHCND